MATNDKKIRIKSSQKINGLLDDRKKELGLRYNKEAYSRVLADGYAEIQNNTKINEVVLREIDVRMAEPGVKVDISVSKEQFQDIHNIFLLLPKPATYERAVQFLLLSGLLVANHIEL